MTAQTDFNDLAALAGLEAVRQMVDQADAPPDDDDVARLDADLARFDARIGTQHEPTATAPEWPEPTLPGHLRTPDIPADLLPTWLGDMARAVSNSTQTPPALAVMSALAVLATVLQRRFEVAPYGDSYTEPLALWTLSASPSGTRKTAVLNAMLGPLVHWEKLLRDRMRGEIAKVNAQRAVAKKRIERLQVDAAKAKDASERAGDHSRDRARGNRHARGNQGAAPVHGRHHGRAAAGAAGGAWRAHGRAQR